MSRMKVQRVIFWSVIISCLSFCCLSFKVFANTSSTTTPANPANTSTTAKTANPANTSTTTNTANTANTTNSTNPNKQIAEQNLQKGKAFLEENKKRPHIQTLTSGLQYKVIKEGEGSSPGPTDFVTVNYRGTLIEGSEFDSSYSRGTPSTFAMNSRV